MKQLLFPRSRPQLLAEIKGRAFELGVGTGRNFVYRPMEEQAGTLGVDAAESALKRAERKPQCLRLDLALLWADAQRLPFPNGSFAAAFATFVCCSVTDRVLGLKEAYEFLKRKADSGLRTTSGPRIACWGKCSTDCRWQSASVAQTSTAVPTSTLDWRR